MRSLKTPLINCKVELKLKSTKYCILSAAGNENNVNDMDNVNNIIFTITQNYMSLVNLYQQKTIKHYQNFMLKDLKDQCIGMNITTVRIKQRRE